MTVTPAQIMRSCLVKLGLVSYPPLQTNLPLCFTSSMPTTPDTLVFIKGGHGKRFGRQSRDGKSNLYPGIVIIIRTPDETGYDLANRIAIALDQQMFPFETTLPTVEGGATIELQNVIRTTEIVTLGEEVGTKRQLWSINAMIAFASTEPSIG